MTIDWKKAYFVNSLEDYKKQREKKEGLKNLFLEKLDCNKSKEEITYTWDEPRTKEPGADYKPGRFKHLDEAIRNTKKGSDDPD